MKLLEKVNGGYMIWCPGCRAPHVIAVEKPLPNGACWTFNGNEDSPTFNPSVRLRWTEGRDRFKRCCHFFIEDGKIKYCSDCTHLYAGQTIDLANFKEAARELRG